MSMREKALARIPELLERLDTLHRDRKDVLREFREKERQINKELEKVRAEIRSGAFQQELELD